MRQQVSLDAAILDRSGSAGPGVRIADVCEHGLSFSSPISFVAGEAVILHIPLYGQTHVVKGVIKRVSGSLGMQLFAYGIEYITPDPAFLKNVLRFCSEQCVAA
jgi:hypothetical protein